MPLPAEVRIYGSERPLKKCGERFRAMGECLRIRITNQRVS